MKISVTEKFLWDLYQLIEKADGAANFMFKSANAKNWLPGVENPVFEKYRKNKTRKEFANLICYLKNKGYLRTTKLQNIQGIIITKSGIDKALKAGFKLGEGKKRKDGKWIMLIFDLPKKYNKSRDLLRSILRNLGYKLLQQSVWVTPYDVSEETEKLLENHSLETFVKIFLIEEI
jgi:hypothetical protein